MKDKIKLKMTIEREFNMSDWLPLEKVDEILEWMGRYEQDAVEHFYDEHCKVSFEEVK